LFPPEHRPDGGVAVLTNRLVWNPGEAVMPSANRFAFVRETVRNHPGIVASWAATAGILLGGFVTLKVMAPEPRVEKIGTTHAAIETKAAPKSVAETTGSAPSAETVASTDCDKQTWPYLSRACMEAMRGKNREPRVVSTDTLDKPTISAIESPTPAPPAEQPKPADPPPSAPVVASTAPAATAEPATAAPTAVEVDPVPVAKAEEKPSPPADQKEAKQEKHERFAKKAKRKLKFDPKAEPKAQPKDQSDDGDGDVASAEADDRPSEGRIARGRADRRRIVERWTERDYNVPSTDGRGDRRVTVIRRDNGGGIFGNLFGGFGN
jgi:hypothetical protein